MKVILLRDVARIGRRFEIKEVPSGHALNFLVPQKLAQIATPENIKRVTAQKTKQAEHVVLHEQTFEQVLKELNAHVFTLPAQANVQGHLFKGVKADDVGECLRAHGVAVENAWIVLSHPLKAVGEHTIELALGNTHGSFHLQIVAK